MPPEWTRRSVVAGMAALMVPRPAFGLGSGSLFNVAELEVPGASIHRPEAWSRMLHEVIQATSIEADPAIVRVAPDDPALFEHPFAVLVGDGALPEFSDAAIRQLRNYISYGGFLLFDDASGTGRGAFAASVRRISQRIFPTRPLSPLAGDHAVYRSFFLLDRPVGRTRGTGVLEGIQLGPTTPLMMCPADLSGALDRTADGRNRTPLVGGELQRREATKLSINLVLYALTSNYKHDIAHVVELMRGGRLE
ncbi:MAG: DUF4159 domain-containing protein [Myxococcota bacterium]|nr:DUF4159 domain-containing protein [Myxococcota bacterium]